MKSIIIVTASTGAGHNQAAANLKRQFEERGIYVHIVDMFKSTGHGMNMLVADGYKLLAEKMPKAYGMIYKSADHRRINKVIFRNIFMTTEYRLRWIFKEFKPDLIISTHPFGAPLVGKLKEKGKINVPFVQIITDFKAHYTYIHQRVDAYIAASDYTKRSLVERGVVAERVYKYGIPAKEEFMQSVERKFSHDRPFHVLIMGGSMGLSAMEDAINALIDVKNNLKLSVVCGKNEALYKRFSQIYQTAIADGKIDLYGYIDHIYQLMDACDLIISKPGGLTTTEAIHKCIPMIIPFAIPGQEEENMNFLVENNMAIEVKNVAQLHRYIEQIISDPAYYEQMVTNMLNLSKTYSVTAIIDLCLHLIENTH